MLDGGGEFFWVLVAVIGVVTLGGGLAMSLVREQEPTEEEVAASEEASRRQYVREARDGVR